MTQAHHVTIFDAKKTRPFTRQRGKQAGSRERFTRFVRLSPDKLNSHFKPTDQDTRILLTLAERRALTAAQIKVLVFPHHKGQDQCNHRLKLLFHYGYVLRLHQHQTVLENKPFINLLDHKGARQVATLKGCTVRELGWSRHDRYTNPSHFDHVLRTNWVRLWIEQAAQEASVTITRWYDERTLQAMHRSDVIEINGVNGEKVKTHLYPDSYFVAGSSDRILTPFLEVDLRTEALQTHSIGVTTEKIPKTWAMKIHKYNAYFARKRGVSLYQQRYGAGGERVLTITTSQKRLASLKRATEAAGGKRRYWFTTFEQVKRENVFTAPIWQIASNEGEQSLLAPDEGIADR